jgi:hypothetical protein
MRTKAEISAVAALASCLRRYPGRVISLHSDNGNESTPGHLTRSRPYHKDDNAHVEEKQLHHSHVRRVRPV